jgi:hypothetical protein
VLIPGLFNTGVSDTGLPLADDAVELHYSYGPGSAVTNTPFVITAGGGYPIGPWLGDDPLSAWIAPSEDSVGPNAANGSPNYAYQLSLDLTGLNPATAVIEGLWSTDDKGIDILINGISTGQSNTLGFVSWTSFQVTNGFTAGTNVLTFLVNNGVGQTAPSGPTGLRVEMVGTAAPLEIMSVTNSAGGLTLVWSSAPGRTYRVQFKADLSATTWTDLSGDVTATGRTATKSDSTLGGATQRFYRVIQLP